MRNAFLITALLLCLAATTMAAKQKQEAQPQSNQPEQMQMVRNEADASMDHAPAVKNECTPKTEKPAKNTQDDADGDPEASQNCVEYGGGG